MNKLSSFIFFVLVTTAAFGQSVYDCSLLNPLVSQSDIDNSGTEFFKQCVLFDGIYNFDQADEHTVTARENIHLKAGFHSGSYVPNGYMHLKLDEQPPAYDVSILNYPDLNGILRYKKMEFGIDMQGELLERITKFIDPAYVTGYDALNPFLDWELDINVKFTHPATGTVKWRDGFFYQDYTVSGNDWVPTSTNPYPMRIRFAPPENGYWLAEVSITYRIDQTTSTYQTIDLPPFAFNVIESGHPGYVKVHYNNRNLQRGADIIFPIGHTFPGPYNRVDGTGKTAWGDPVTTNKNANAADWAAYIGDIASYISQGGNCIKLAQTTYGNLLEFEIMGNYYPRMHYAWEQDQILEMCEANDVLVDFNLLFQDAFMAYSQNGGKKIINGQTETDAIGNIAYWGNPWDYGNYYPYYVNNDNANLPMTNPNDYFDTYCYFEPGTLPSDMFLDPVKMDHHKQRTRYYVARYGYSPQIYTWELMSEPFWMDALNVDTDDENTKALYRPALNPSHPGHQAAIAAINTYHNTISSYLKNELGVDHLVAMSFAPLVITAHYKSVVNSAGSSNIDLIGINQYSNYSNKLVQEKSGNNNGKKNLDYWDPNESSEYKYIRDLAFNYNKPIYLSEVGHPWSDECKGITGNVIDVMTYPFSGIAAMHPWGGYSYGGTDVSGNVIEYDRRLFWSSTISAQNYLNSDKFTTTLDHWSGWWQQGRQIQFISSFGNGGEEEIKELQYYLSQSKKYATGYVRNRSFNIWTMRLNQSSVCDMSNEEAWGSYTSSLQKFLVFDWEAGGHNLFVYGVEKNKYHQVKWYDFLSGNLFLTQIYSSDNQNRLRLEYPLLSIANPQRPILWFIVENLESSGLFAINDSIVDPHRENYGAVGQGELQRGKIIVAPNPFENYISVISEQDDEIEIRDMNGALITERGIVTGESVIFFENLPKGVYLLRFIKQERLVKIVKL